MKTENTQQPFTCSDTIEPVNTHTQWNFYLTIFKHRNRQFLLCHNRHATFQEAKACLDSKGHNKPGARVYKMVGDLTFMLTAMLGLDEQGNISQPHSYNNWGYTDVRELFKSGINRSIEDMREEAEKPYAARREKANAKNKAKREAKTLADKGGIK